MPIKDYTTKVDIFTTIGQIQRCLVKHGAKRILQEYEGERTTALCFMIDTPIGIQAVRLPANVESVQIVLTKQKVKCDYAQTERVAWRIVKDWIDAQMAILESQMVTIDQIFLPYMMNHDGQTVYELFQSKQLLLGEAES